MILAFLVLFQRLLPLFRLGLFTPIPTHPTTSTANLHIKDIASIRQY